MNNLKIAYGSQYLDWQLGEGHPTNPERALIATELIVDELGSGEVEIVLPEIREGDIERLYEIHSPYYVDDVLAGNSWEWTGTNPKLGQTALAMFSGTARLVDMMIADDSIRVAFNPQGAKHHAHYYNSGGFCVFNDMAYSAVTFANLGLKVMYVDWDAHHGDGVEELLFDTGVPTMSIHDVTAYPGTGREGHDLEHLAYNWALPRESGDLEFADAMNDIKELADEIKPDVILLATGADAHETDPLSSLNFTYKGYGYASSIIAEIANKYSSRVLIGGAGGYQPHTHTPAVWAQVVTDIYQKVGK